jgi:uncharacterized protein YlxW (UPF0749 family)
MDQKRQLEDYLSLLEFARQELKLDQKKLVETRDVLGPDELDRLEKDIETLKMGIDRYQKNIKTLKLIINDSDCQ